jgi:hypothetical protein
MNMSQLDLRKLGSWMSGQCSALEEIRMQTGKRHRCARRAIRSVLLGDRVVAGFGSSVDSIAKLALS